MSGGIDHLVLGVRDIDQARETYSRMGFTLTPYARHPFGTANSLVQLGGSFLELVHVADPHLIAPHGNTTFSFAAYVRDYLKHGEGLAMLVFETLDARSDAADFAARGLDTYEPFDFQRQARLPDGTEATVGFSLAFVTHKDMPRAVFFTCQQHAPEYFWNAGYQRHDNGALDVAEVILVAGAPAGYRSFLEALKRSGEVTLQGDGLKLATPRGTVTILDEGAYTARFGLPAPDLASGAQFAGYTIAVSSLQSLTDCLDSGAMVYTTQGCSVVVAPDRSMGAMIAFVEADWNATCSGADC